MVDAFFWLAIVLTSRFIEDKQPEDIKSSVEYLRFIQIHFYFLEPFSFSHDQLASCLVWALTKKVEFGYGDTTQDIEEIVGLIPKVLKVLSSEASTRTREAGTSDLAFRAIRDFAGVITNNFNGLFHRKDIQQLADRVIQTLREVTELKADDISFKFALADCLATRFSMTHVINDYEDAMAIADKIVAIHSPGNSLTRTQRNAMGLITFLLVTRLNTYSKPEYIEDAIHRIQNFLSLPTLPDEDRTNLTDSLGVLDGMRSSFHANTRDTLPNLHSESSIVRTTQVTITRHRNLLGESSPWPRLQEKEKYLSMRGVFNAIIVGAITDIEAGVERARNLLPSHRPSDEWSFAFYKTFADILYFAHQCTKRLDYLNEAISGYRDLRKLSAAKITHFQVVYMLLQSLFARFKSSNLWRDFDELMQLFPELVNDDSAEVFNRFEISDFWASMARLNKHPSMSSAYETAMSLLQETLVFSPTLQTQHLRLAYAFRQGGLPLEYASYQIEKGQFKLAVETLERGRALLWSEMRGLRTSTDQLRAANPALADKFVDINQRLESVTTSVVQSDENEMGRGQTGTGRRQHSLGHLVPTQRRLLEERAHLISHIQSLPGFENFLKPLPFDALNSAAASGPVIIINMSRSKFSSIILLLKDSTPSVISTPPDFHDHANRLKKKLLQVRKEKGLDSKDYDRALASVLFDLYELVGRPVVGRLHQLEVPEKSRVWWCPTEAFCSLPLHAMGPIPSDDGKELYFSDLYIPSYTPTLSALIESRKHESLSDAFDHVKPSILLVAQPDTLPGAFGEIKVIESTQTSVTTLISAMATPETVIEGLRAHRFAHFVCHGLLETGKPFDASLELYKDNLTLLNIVRSQLPSAEFVFLSACHTAELTEDSVADEGLHLAAAMQFCGFRSVVGTMWAMADTDGADLSRHFYKAIFADKASQNGVPYHERSARALQIAVKKLRKKRGMTLERWVNFVHYGA
jgi:CHAT domain-containing protein